MNEWKGGPMDKIEKFDDTLIHHGKFSNRLYILKFSESGKTKQVRELLSFAVENQYSKVVGKIPKTKLSLFLRNGFKQEATVPKFYNGKTACCFVSKFIDIQRAVFDAGSLKAFKNVLANYEQKSYESINSKFELRSLHADDVGLMVSVFNQVFETYPFPIHSADYVKHTMENDVCYYGIFEADTLLAISSAEVDRHSENAEMTDFAVLPEARGKGLSKLLLAYMEEQMHVAGIKTLYTIARLESLAMNKTFLGAGYSYAGTLINNTNISGGIESMNVLYKFV